MTSGQGANQGKRVCAHKRQIGIPATAVQGEAMTCWCMNCKELLDVRLLNDPVYWKDPGGWEVPHESLVRMRS